ncbi:glucose-6-phosphate 1-dehydrogenase [Nitrosococcus halophilus Nc 4]|uniref:Glucose-6-phosphate 1-dehydrogenase n=1 Tax=Nitrosococcus halophilus (strain Nc4) TaxID=472759 RepID=D5BY02_NITHN|nr:glucose-6-phosphate dehydrogenase [Nitrosococcus halophilus]ADE15913.1 glucose-6-phosphate 1-dehydrogenase [Nitrosococcus halophilus Nc 4]
MEPNHPQQQPTVFVLFGAGGDLSWRLILPALFNLYLDKYLPEQWLLIGVDRQDYDQHSLAQHYREGIQQYSRRGIPDDKTWQSFSQALRYQQADITDPTSYTQLAKALVEQDKTWHGKAERVFYLATPPFLFADIAKGLGEANLAKARQRARIVVEKPLGHDLESFRGINQALNHYFQESQIYRIDHFLGKETVQNILALRFANPIFEPIWNRRYIDHIAITVAETLGVEHRANYYEGAGALRDMVQNHLLQLLCLVAMEPPVVFDAHDLRDRRMDVMHAIRPISAEEVQRYAARGQYGAGWMNGTQVPAYREEKGVAPDSNTETYCALEFHVDNWRWQGVPFYLRTGKRLPVEASEISIRFQDIPHQAFPTSAGLNAQPAQLVIRLQPEEGIVLKFMAKQPGPHLVLRPVEMRFSYQEAFQATSPTAYETLLWDIMKGDATLFTRADQVEAAWRLLMPILEVWEANPATDFPNYRAGTWGPEAAEVLIAHSGRSWLAPTLPEPKGGAPGKSTHHPRSA